MSTTRKAEDVCFYCGHTFDVHTGPGKTCAVCLEKQGGMPELPDTPPLCTTFRTSYSCAICHERIAWQFGVENFTHSDPAMDEDHPARSEGAFRVQQV